MEHYKLLEETRIEIFISYAAGRLGEYVPFLAVERLINYCRERGLYHIYTWRTHFYKIDYNDFTDAIGQFVIKIISKMRELVSEIEDAETTVDSLLQKYYKEHSNVPTRAKNALSKFFREFGITKMYQLKDMYDMYGIGGLQAGYGVGATGCNILLALLTDWDTNTQY